VTHKKNSTGSKEKRALGGRRAAMLVSELNIVTGTAISETFMTVRRDVAR